ncbi:hypothetical protein ABIA39_007000 [Nocardia sp. GAS34]
MKYGSNAARMSSGSFAKSMTKRLTLLLPAGSAMGAVGPGQRLHGSDPGELLVDVHRRQQRLVEPLARLLGLPYFPVTPLFPHLGLVGCIPLPSKWYIEFGEPIATGAYGPQAAEAASGRAGVTDRLCT